MLAFGVRRPWRGLKRLAKSDAGLFCLTRAEGEAAEAFHAEERMAVNLPVMPCARSTLSIRGLKANRGSRFTLPSARVKQNSLA